MLYSPFLLAALFVAQHFEIADKADLPFDYQILLNQVFFVELGLVELIRELPKVQVYCIDVCESPLLELLQLPFLVVLHENIV